MKDSQNRRVLLKNLSLLTVGGLFGIDDQTKNQVGGMLKHDQGEVFYIGETRKARVIIKISKTAESTPGMSLLSELIKPGDGIPEHKHLHEEEFLFVQQGKVLARLNDEEALLSPGDLIYVAKGEWHGFKNLGPEDVMLFFGYSPAGFEDYFRAIGTTDINESLGFSREDWVKVNQKYGVVYR